MDTNNEAIDYAELSQRHTARYPKIRARLATMNTDTTTNLYNPLWAYDLFPLCQSDWNRMPFEGTESQNGSEQQQQPEDENDAESEGNEDINSDDIEVDQDNPEPSESDDDEQESTPSDSDEDNKPDDDAFDEEQEEQTQHVPQHVPTYELSEPNTSNEETIPNLTITTAEDGTIQYFREFQSWNEFVRIASDPNLYRWKYKHVSIEPEPGKYGKDWFQTPNMEAVTSMALYRGWPEGQKLLHEFTTNVLPQQRNLDIWQFDVAGAFPIIPMYVSGDPLSMINDPGTDLRTQYPIIQIDYDHWIDNTVPMKDMMLRGAAVLSLAKTLEDHGFQVELRIVSNSYNNAGTKDIHFGYSVIFKKPGEYLDLDRAAFAMCHTSSIRRLGFALYEQHPELERPFNHYGFQLGQPIQKPSFQTIYIPGTTGGETPEKAQQAVETAMKQTLNAIDAAEAAN